MLTDSDRRGNRGVQGGGRYPARLTSVPSDSWGKGGGVGVQGLAPRICFAYLDQIKRLLKEFDPPPSGSTPVMIVGLKCYMTCSAHDMW